MTSNSRHFETQRSRRDDTRTTEDLIERAVSEARKLPSYESHDEESTARHAVPQDIHFHVHPSQPDRDTAPQIELGPFKARGLPKWLVAVLAGIVAAGTAIVAHFARK